MQTRRLDSARLRRWRGDGAAVSWLSLFVIGFCLVGGCTRQLPPSAETPTLRLGAQQTPEAENVFVQMLSAEPLLVLDWHGRAVPRLASEWKWQDNGRSLSVQLPPGVRFHDGTPVTAAAVASILRKNIPDERADGFHYLTSIETPNDQTLVFRLRPRKKSR